jgi:heterodisulfide reductase subunit D
MKSAFTGLRREALICARCGYCQPVCPTYAELGWESAGPRGRMAIAYDCAAGRPITPEQARRVFECTLCGRCREVCPTRIETGEVWQELRGRIAAAGLLAAWPLAIVRNNLAAGHNITGEEAEHRLLWQQDLDLASADLNLRRGAGVVYFAGCVASLYPQTQSIAQTMAQLLALAEVPFTTLGSEEWCCGFPLLGMGLKAEAVELAEHNLRAVLDLGARTVVTTCPSCYHMWRDVYPVMAGVGDSLRVVHATEFLAELLDVRALKPHPLEETATYHDPCDLGRNSGVYEAPRAVLRTIPGLELVEMADNRERAFCCGGGGNLEAVNADLVAAIAGRRLGQATAIGAQLLVTPCQQCKRTLAGAARRAKSRMKVQDVTEVLWRALE